MSTTRLTDRSNRCFPNGWSRGVTGRLRRGMRYTLLNEVAVLLGGFAIGTVRCVEKGLVTVAARLLFADVVLVLLRVIGVIFDR